MIHLPYASMISGTADELTNVAATLKEIERRYVSTYAVRSGLSEAESRKMCAAETWLKAERAVELHFTDEIDTSLMTASAVTKSVLNFKHVPKEVRAMAGVRPNFDAERDRRQRQQRRMMLIAAQANQTREQDAADAELGALVRRRRALHDVVARVHEDERARDAEERAAAARRLKADITFNWHNVPRVQRRYD